MSHSVIDPAILCWGTPVVLITTINEDGSSNITPISSALWLINRCILVLEFNSQGTMNLQRTRQCVLNLPSDEMVPTLNAMARSTGAADITAFKMKLGYRHDADKFKTAGLTPQTSDLVQPPRIRECPVQMEAELVKVNEMMGDVTGEAKGFVLAVEVKIVRTHVVDSLRLSGHDNKINPDNWKPMIMMFQHLYGLSNGRLLPSTLANIEEELYRVGNV